MVNETQNLSCEMILRAYKAPLYKCRGPSTNQLFYAKQTQFPKNQK